MFILLEFQLDNRVARSILKSESPFPGVNTDSLGLTFSLEDGGNPPVPPEYSGRSLVGSFTLFYDQLYTIHEILAPPS